MFDLVLRGGEVIDGTGAARFRADIGVSDGVIQSIGNLSDAEGERSIELSGRCIAPGFIDVHNHSDGWMLRQPTLDPKVSQGFTTEVLAADGIGYAPVSDATARQWVFYLQGLDALRCDQYHGWKSLEEMMLRIDGRHVQNAATHIPYANLRAMACGWGRGPVDDFQMREIQHQIRIGMEMGAVGLSTGLDYISQCFSNTQELIEACTAMAPYGGLYVTHMRYKKGLLEGLREAFEIGRAAGVPVHISHLKAFSADTIEQVLEVINEAARDVDLSFDVYPYQPGSTMLNYLLPYEFWEQGPLASMDLLNDPAMRDNFRRGLDAQRLDLDHIRIAWTPGAENQSQWGKTLSEYVAESGKSAAEALCDLLLEERMGVLCVMDEGDDALVRPFLQHRLYMMGTDGIYHPDALVHPRMFGSAGRLLGPCVRDWNLFRLEDAVRKMTSWPAERFGLDRGVLAEGQVADLVVFDPQAVADHATFVDPTRFTRGIDHVIVGGVEIMSGGECHHPTQLPGRFLRSTKRHGS